MKTSIPHLFSLGILTCGVAQADPALTQIAAPAAVISVAPTLSPAVGTPALTGLSTQPSVQYTLSIGRPNAAPAETAADQLFAASDAVAKARTQVEKELAVLGTGSGSGTPARTLVIPRDGADPKSLSDMEEDLSVMSHIIDKAASSRDEKSARAMGISIHGPLSSSAAPRTLYLDGYGALFFLNVNFPLLPPPTKKEDTQPKEETSTEWEDARRELFQPSSYSSDLPRLFAVDQGANAFAFSTGGQPEEYDADKVEELKKSLITSLKNAVHIRKLKGDETVTIVVTGRGPVTEMKSNLRRTSGTRSPNVWTTTRSTGGDSKGTKLIVRAKKSDIEAFQKDKTSLDDFRKKVTVMTY